ncbi:hypothetical protein B566_EDAN016181 [Ephemera danica]|nr:hypothetical protein B566_EDAN016181 [Ephemera danica]
MLTTLVIGVSCLLIVLCRFNHSVKYYMKFTLYMALTFLFSLIFVPLMVPLGRDSRNGLLPAWAIRNAMRILIGVDYDIRGMQNIIPKVFTHIWRYIPEGSTIARREVFWILPFPWFWNTVYINRLNPNQARNDINDVGKLISTKNTRICMFPEGTRHSGRGIVEFLPAIQTKGKSLDEVMEESRDLMQRSFTRLSEETASRRINR